MNGNLYLFPVQMPELQQMLRQIVKEELSHLSKPTEPETPEIIDRKELCARLNISERTAATWEKKGKIPYMLIGESVRYNWPKVVQALEDNGKRHRRK